MSACPDKLLLLHGLADGELDAANALAIEAHLRTCPACSEEWERIALVREAMATPGLHHPAPASLRDRIERQIGLTEITADRPADRSESASSPPRRRTGKAQAGWLSRHQWSGGLVTGIAASFALMLALPQLTHSDTEDQLVSSHVRSLMATHLTDIATSNRHVVKPWFNGRIDFAPPVPELVRDGFPLVGGRLDYIDDHVVAAIVYHRRLHTINLFVRPAGTFALPVPVTTRHDGYSLVRWTSGGLEYWAVSDIDPDELQLFRRTFIARASGGGPA